MSQRITDSTVMPVTTMAISFMQRQRCDILQPWTINILVQTHCGADGRYSEALRRPGYLKEPTLHLLR